MSIYKYKDNVGEDDGKCHSSKFVRQRNGRINLPTSRVALFGPATALAMTQTAPHLLA